MIRRIRRQWHDQQEDKEKDKDEHAYKDRDDDFEYYISKKNLSIILKIVDKKFSYAILVTKLAMIMTKTMTFAKKETETETLGSN